MIKKNGFTLIEVMIVIGLVGIILSIGIASLQNMSGKVERWEECRARCRPQAMKDAVYRNDKLECVCDSTAVVK